MTSCTSSRTTTATERSEARTETAYTTVRQADSVHVTDSVFVYVTEQRVVETRWRTEWRERTVHDTVREHSTDTIVKTETVEKVKEVPAKGSNTGWGVAAALFLLMAVYVAVKLGLKGS